MFCCKLSCFIHAGKHDAFRATQMIWFHSPCAWPTGIGWAWRLYLDPPNIPKIVLIKKKQRLKHVKTQYLSVQVLGGSKYVAMLIFVAFEQPRTPSLTMVSQPHRHRNCQDTGFTMMPTTLAKWKTSWWIWWCFWGIESILSETLLR